MQRTSWPAARSLGLVLAGIGIFALSTEAWSQVAEIIVTTRKREESLQEIPVAVQAVNAEDIERRGLTSLADIIRQSPSVILDQGFAPQDQRITIRGLAPTRGRQNVAVLVDDIDVSSESIGTLGGSLLINPQLFDLEQVEIVKGPQNALYGRSAFAGAINYITKKPGDVFDASVGADVGSDGQMMFRGSVSGPLTDSLSGGISAMNWDHDGFYTNPFTNGEVGGKDGTGIAGTLVWHATDTLKLTGRLENLDDHFEVTPYAVVRYPAGQVPNPATPQFNTNFPINPTAGDGGAIWCVPACPAAPGTLAPVITSATFPGYVPGVNGKLPDGDTQQLTLSEDPRTCPDTYPTSLGGCQDFPGTDRDITRFTLTLDWDAGLVDVKSLSHIASGETLQQQGAKDVSAASSSFGSMVHIDTDTDLLSQEFRVLSKPGGPVTWAAGALYWLEEVEVADGSNNCLNYQRPPGFPPAPFNGICGPSIANIVDTGPLPLGSITPLADPNRVPLNPNPYDRETEHYSVYALVEWQFAEEWKVAFEARQTWEELRLQGPGAANNAIGSYGNGLWDPSGTYPCGTVPPFTARCPSIGPGTIDLDGAGPGGFATYAPTLTSLELGTIDDDFFAPKATLTWAPDQDMLFYFSWAEAFKPEGISPFTGGTGVFDPVGNTFKQEKLQVWELGAKTSWFDRRLVANLTGFFQDFKNKQVGTSVEVNGILLPRTVNAGKAEVWGTELELTWFATDNLNFNLAYTWLDTEYKSYLNTTSSAATIGYLNNCVAIVRSRNTPIATGPYAGKFPSACVLDYSGKELENAPENSLVGSARYQHQLVEDTDWFVEGDFQYQDDRFQSASNNAIWPSYWLANFRAGISSPQWDVVAYVDNAFDDDTFKTGLGDVDLVTFQTTNQAYMRTVAIMPDPRTYGLRVNYRFGGE